MEIMFVYRYVNDKCLYFDKYNRWRIDILIFPKLSSLPNYDNYKEAIKQKNVPVCVGYIFQKGSIIGEVPSVNHRFSATIPTFDNSLNFGFTGKQYIFNNDLNLLMNDVVNQLNFVKNVFKSCK